MRWACILLPHLAIDAVLRRHPEPAAPLALVTGPAQRQVLHAVSPAAKDLGLQRGMLLSAAQLLAPGMRVQPHALKLDADTYEKAVAK